MASVLLEGDGLDGASAAAGVLGDNDIVPGLAGDLHVLPVGGDEALAFFDLPLLVQLAAARVAVLLALVFGVSGGVPCGKEGAEREDGEDYECCELHCGR